MRDDDTEIPAPTTRPARRGRLAPWDALSMWAAYLIAAATLAYGLLVLPPECRLWAFTAGLAIALLAESLRHSRRRTKTELMAAEARFRGLVEQTLVGIYIMEGGYFRYVNPAFVAVFGYDSADDIVGRIPVQEFIFADDRAMVADNVRRRVERQQTDIRYEFRGVTRDDRVIDIEAHGRSFVYEGRPALIGAILDISERRQAERAIRESEERFSTVFHANPVAISITRLSDGVLIDANDALLELYDYRRDELIGHTPQQLDIWVNFHQRTQMIETLKRGGGPQMLELQLKRKTGEIRDVLATASLIRIGGELHLLGMISDLTDRNRAQLLEHMAHHDVLTDLPNRLLLQSRLAHSLERVCRYGGLGAVLFLDLDRFKPINDDWGHEAGDEVLRLAARRLSARLRAADTLARLGGDEFVVVLEDLPNADKAGLVASDLIQHLNYPFHLAGGQTVTISGSIGISLFPDHGTSGDQLIQAADAALYQAKRAGGNTFAVFRQAGVPAIAGPAAGPRQSE